MDKEEQQIKTSSDASKVKKPKKSYQFQAGNKCGVGRIKGSKSNAQMAIEEIGEKHAAEAYMMIVKSAMGEKVEGDLASCKYIIDRCVPIRKGARISLNLPNTIQDVEQLDEASNKVFNMMANAQISLEEATMLCSVIEFRSKTIELRDGIGQIAEMRKEIEVLKRKDGF